MPHTLALFGRPRHWSDSHTFSTAVIVFLVLVSSTALWHQARSVDRLRLETTSQIQLRATQVTSAASSAVSILFRTVDFTARHLAEGYVNASEQEFEKRAQLSIERLPPGAIQQVAIISADGYLAYSNLGMTEKVFLGDRDHFKVHAESGRDQLFVSKPLLERVTKQWSVQFSRPILREGKFIGVAVVSVSPEHLQEALVDVALGSGDFIGVVRQTGELLTLNRDMDTTLGKTLDPDRPYLQVGAPSTGSYRARTNIDDVERISYWQRLDDYPVVVVLGLSSKSAFEPIERALADDDFTTILELATLWFGGISIALLVRRMNAQSRKRREMEFVAMNDTLTGLQSRHALMIQLDQALVNAAAEGTRLGILFLDLDGFKPVNDLYGHAAGDEVLKLISGRIKACVRKGDIVARIGGDEFVVVVRSMLDDEALPDLRGRISQSLADPFAIAGTEVRVGASIGMATFPEQGTSADVLLSLADDQMYKEKVTKAEARRTPISTPTP